jgi:hypothetical protein
MGYMQKALACFAIYPREQKQKQKENKQNKRQKTN